MKKLFLVAAIAAMTMSSCSKNEIDSGSTSTTSNDAIGFSTFVGINSKGLVTDNTASASTTGTTIQDTGFGVYGYYHAYTQAASSTAGKFVDTSDSASTANFMYNQKVEWGTYTGTTSGWYYSPVKYWPNNTLDRLSFFAFAPYTATGVDITSTGTPSVEFTIEDAPEDMIDLVADMQYNIAKSSTDVLTSSPSTVSFELQHILTRADIAVRLGDDITVKDDLQDADSGGNTYTSVYLTDLQLVGSENADLYDATGAVKKSTGLRSTGVFNVTASTELVTDVNKSSYENSSTDDYIVDYKLGAWDYTSGNAATLQTANYDLHGSTTTSGIVNLIYNSPQNRIGQVYNAAGTELVGGYGTNYKFNVPQPVTSSTSTETYTRVFKENHYLFLVPQQSSEVTYLYVQYDVVTVDSSLALGYSSVTNYAIIELSGLTDYGTAYRYNLTLGLSSVKVSATVDEDWASSTDQFGDIEVEVATSDTDPDAAE